MKADQTAGSLSIAFKASCGWLDRRKQRYKVGMRARTNSTQRVPSDHADHLHTFQTSVLTTQKAKNIGPADIVNMDHTMCRFNMPPSPTNNKKGKRCFVLNDLCRE